MKLAQLFLVTLLTIFLTACGSDNSESSNASQNQTGTTGTDNTVEPSDNVTIVIIGGDSTVLETNNQQASINIRVLGVDNSPYTEGTVNVAYPDKVKLGTDIGAFTSSSVTIDENGNAVFNYTAPDNLAERVAVGDTSTVFGFYHSSDITSIKYYTVRYSPLADQIVLTDYALKESASSEEYTMNLESSRQASYYVEDSSGNKVKDDDITNITVTLKNPNLADLRDTSGNVGDQLSFTKNNVSVSIASNTKSGLLPIEVNATFKDVNGDTRNIVKIFNVTILSGPPTAMSISYEGTEHDEANAKFQEHMVITVTDKYFNHVNTQPAVSAYMIAGYTLENSSDPASRLHIATTSSKAATMNPTTNTLTSTANLSNVDLSNDILLTFANGYTYNVSGKWDMKSISGGTISLLDNMDATKSVSNIGFAIGNNYRQDTCRDGREWVGYVSMQSDRLDENGLAHAIINYDYYLTGKKIVLGIDLVGYTANGDITSKFGESVGHTLLSVGLEPKGTCSVSAGSVHKICTIEILIAETGEYYRNANMGYNVVASDNLTVHSVSNSNGQIFDCASNGGVAYVDINVTEKEGRAGTVSLEAILPSNEF
jgi:hypothetical protein